MFNDEIERKAVEIEEKMKKWAKEYVFQIEICPVTQKPHIQGYCWLNKPQAFEYIRKNWGLTHIERANNIEACRNYCKKEETSTGKRWTNIKAKRDILEGIILKDWQLEILEIIQKEPDMRKVYWYYDIEGKIGKTTTARWLIRKTGRDDILLLGGKAGDMKYAAMKHVQQKKEIGVVIIDYVRSQEQFISYQGIEEIKNGLFFNTKYETGMVDYDPPHMIIFANFRPDESKLSQDRWVIKQI